MDRRELLKMAAKAAGIKVKWITRHDVGITDSYIVPLPEHAHHFILNKYPYPCWDPLEDDGDALRLAVMLGLFMRQAVKEIPRAEYGKDPYAATRRAITRAAAEIGKEMP